MFTINNIFIVIFIEFFVPFYAVRPFFLLHETNIWIVEIMLNCTIEEAF